jgi:hypothetical protein
MHAAKRSFHDFFIVGPFLRQNAAVEQISDLTAVHLAPTPLRPLRPLSILHLELCHDQPRLPIRLERFGNSCDARHVYSKFYFIPNR